MIGSTIAGRYEVEEQIGIGGMGIVYRAHDATLRREVALKIIAPHLMQQTAARERFQKEAQALAGLTHPNIVSVYDFVEDEKTQNAVLVMELLRGASLRQRMADTTRPAFSDVAVQTCKALEAAHSQGILHRDIKPENIFVCRDGTLKLMDFGLARLVGSNSTQTGAIAGTISYMAPEQLRGEKLDVRSDLYSLGILLYEYLTGVTPFASDNPGAVLMKHLNEPPPSLREKLPTLPVEIENIVLKLLAKSPDERYPSATALHEALENPTPSGNATQVELANAAATLPKIAPPPPSFVPQTAPFPPRPSASGSGSGPYLVSAQKKRSVFAPLAVALALLGSVAGAGYLYAHQTIPLNVARKPQERKAPATRSLTAKPKQSEPRTPDEAAALEREVRREKIALERERLKAEKLQRELAAKNSAPKYADPNLDTSPPVGDPESAPPVADETPPVPPPAQKASARPAALPAAPKLSVEGEAKYLPQRGTVRVSLNFNSDCNVRFYGIQGGSGQAISLSSSLTRLNVSDTGQGAAPVDLSLDGGAAPQRIIMVASRYDLTNLDSSYPLPAFGNGAGANMARLIRQTINRGGRGRRGPDTVVNSLPVRDWKRKR